MNCGNFLIVIFFIIVYKFYGADRTSGPVKIFPKLGCAGHLMTYYSLAGCAVATVGCDQFCSWQKLLLLSVYINKKSDGFVCLCSQRKWEVAEKLTDAIFIFWTDFVLFAFKHW